MHLDDVDDLVVEDEYLLIKVCPATNLRIEISRCDARSNVKPCESSRSPLTSIILAAYSRPVSFSMHLLTVEDTPLKEQI